MGRSQAIEYVSAEIESNYSDLYVFQPLDQKEEFFIGEAALTAAAVVLLTAFLNGLQSGLQPRLQKWGESLGIWIGNRLESLFKAAPPLNGELDQEIRAAKSLIATTSAKQQAQAAAEVERIIQDTLLKRGMPRDRAAAIAKSTREAAMRLATEA